MLRYLKALGESFWPSSSHTLHCKIRKMHWTILKSPASSNMPFLLPSGKTLNISITFIFAVYFQGWRWHRDKNAVGYLKLNSSFSTGLWLAFAFYESVHCVQKCHQGMKKIMKKSRRTKAKEIKQDALWCERQVYINFLKGWSQNIPCQNGKRSQKDGCKDVSEIVRASSEGSGNWWPVGAQAVMPPMFAGSQQQPTEGGKTVCVLCWMGPCHNSSLPWCHHDCLLPISGAKEKNLSRW